MTHSFSRYLIESVTYPTSRWCSFLDRNYICERQYQQQQAGGEIARSSPCMGHNSWLLHFYSEPGMQQGRGSWFCSTACACCNAFAAFAFNAPPSIRHGSILCRLQLLMPLLTLMHKYHLRETCCPPHWDYCLCN